ncbi:hypothetical protein NQ117_09480 [Paenibacillus sp. SC116]|uniref:hypothetical protein n=1 Tax=Paenibacillus sp. SC116 TaxID=2968986 RepID=UPI00215A266C|nr:hypothetical protein [Paenibacillus sp. SC116]MCR8843918.1 hypothetical protein [Paenibacillus sp. SC116]
MITTRLTYSYDGETILSSSYSHEDGMTKQEIIEELIQMLDEQEGPESLSRLQAFSIIFYDKNIQEEAN